MSDEKIKITIISDLVKINKYRSQVEMPENFFSPEFFTDHSVDDLKKIHEIYTRYLMDYQNIGEPYPSVIEKLEYTNHKIESCINDHKHQAN
jgi:hypothetical protein